MIYSNYECYVVSYLRIFGSVEDHISNIFYIQNLYNINGTCIVNILLQINALPL